MQDSALSHAFPQAGSTETQKLGVCRLFDLEPDLDMPNPKEEELCLAFGRLHKLFEGKSTLKISAEIQEKVHTLYEDINCGLLYGILTDPASAPKVYEEELSSLNCANMESHRFAICVMQYLNFLRITVKDHFNLVSEKLLGLASSYSFGKFGKIPRQQIIWLLETLCDNSIQPFHKTLVFLIRQIKACDLSSNTLNLATGIIRILHRHRERLPSQSLELFHLAVYSFLRMIPEHTTVPQLCRSEIEFVIYSLHKKFPECISIGRDLIRSLQDVSAIPEFSSFWRKLLYEPQSLHKNFSGIAELASTPTPRWIICSRLTPQMEARLGWILLTVPKPLDTSFLSRYVTKFLKTSSYEFIYVDIIRFICTAIHPTNEIIKSNVVQRWDAILYLLKIIRSEKVAQQAKLALFYDFLFWNPNIDSIMNIEPAILLMEKTMKFPNDAYMHISASLIEFLYLTIEHYSQNLSASMALNINLAMRELISKGVLRSMKQLYSLKLNGKSRSQLEALFPQFISNEDSLPSIADIVDYFSLSQVQSRPVSSVLAQLSQSELHSPERNIHQAPPVEVPDTAFLRKSARQVLSEIPPEELDPSRSELIKIIESIKSLEKEPARLIQAIISVHNIFSILDESSTFDLDQKFCGIFSSFEIKLPEADSVFDEGSEWAISPVLCLLEASSEKYESLSSPDDFEWGLYMSIFFKPNKNLASVVLYLWVIRCCLSKPASEQPKIFAHALSKAGMQFSQFLYDCIEIMQHENVDLFFAVVDVSYYLFPQETAGNTELVGLMLQVMDPKNMLSITKKLETSSYRIFGSNNMSTVIRYASSPDKASSELSEPEQTFLWRMLLSEFSERLEEASDLGLRMLETGSILSKSAEATFAFQKLLVGIIPEERHVKLLLISKHVDAVFILRKWSRSPNDHNHIMSLVLSAAKSLESDASKNIINPKYISQVKDIVRQLRDAFQRG